MKGRHILSVVAGVLLAALPAGATSTSDGLVVLVDHVRNTNGFIRVQICGEHDFLRDCPIVGEARAVAGTTAVMIPPLPKGTYAAQVYHDENNNHKVDRALFGIPKEGVGFSNDFKIGLRAPRFAEAAFTYSGGEMRVPVHLKYYLSAASTK